MAWMISVNGFIVDARTMPAEVQAEARRRGLIPDLSADGMGAGGGDVHEEVGGAGTGGSELSEDDGPAMGLGEAVSEVVENIRQEPAPGSGGLDAWDRIVRTVAKEEGLPDSEVKLIEKAIAKAYRGWSDKQRRSIWYETDSGMTDDDDDDDALCDTSFNGIGYALQVELLDEVTRAARQEADELIKPARERSRGKSGQVE